jgi:3-oxoacyl-[acyl-carrier-protein] synthase II
MDRAPRRVVITGMGVISPIGIGLEPFWDALLQGRSGVRRIQSFDPTGLSTTIAGEVVGYDAKKFVPSSQRKNLKIMARDIQLAVGAAKVALEHGGLMEQRPDPSRFGVEFGASMISSDLDELAPSAHECLTGADGFDYKKWGTHAMGAMPPLWMLKYLPNMPACHISILYDLQGPNNSITQSEAASTLAIGEAFRIIARGSADLMLAGGCDSKLHPLLMIRLGLLQLTTNRDDQPEQACRPFDAHRDGTVPSEGAGVVILEELEHAKKRGATIYAELIGFGSGSDASSPERRDAEGAGLRIAIQSALRDARLTPRDIGYFNAHGASTRDGDRLEAQSLRAAFGDHALEVPVSAHKSNMGNTVAAGGAIEFIAGTMALQHRVIPHTLNYATPDPECPLSVVAGSPRELKKSTFLSANVTRLGQAAAVIARKFEG